MQMKQSLNYSLMQALKDASKITDGRLKAGY